MTRPASILFSVIAALSSAGQDPDGSAGPRRTTTVATNQTVAVSHPVDQIWYGHLGWRIRQPVGPDNDVELVCRDVLRVVPGQVETVQRLLALYEQHEARALAAMAACYLQFLNAPGAAERAAALLAEVEKMPDEPGTGESALAEQNFYDDRMITGFDCIRAGNLEGAENAFREILHTFPRNRMALTYLGVVNVLRGEWPMVMMVFSYAHRLHPRDANFAASRARAQGFVGQPVEALIWLQPFLDAQPDNPNLLQTAGLISMQCARPGEATRYFGRWTAADGGNAEAWTSYGIALTLTDQPVFARVALTRARQMDPGRKSILLFLALNAARANKPAEMQGYIRDLIKQTGIAEAARIIRSTAIPKYFPAVEDLFR